MRNINGATPTSTAFASPPPLFLDFNATIVPVSPRPPRRRPSVSLFFFYFCQWSTKSLRQAQVGFQKNRNASDGEQSRLDITNHFDRITKPNIKAIYPTSQSAFPSFMRRADLRNE